MKQLKLYSRVECPLCEHAAELLLEAGLDFVEADIDDFPELIPLYHVRIPVLSNGSDELNWPFSMAEARELAHG